MHRVSAVAFGKCAVDECWWLWPGIQFQRKPIKMHLNKRKQNTDNQNIVNLSAVPSINAPFANDSDNKGDGQLCVEKEQKIFAIRFKSSYISFVWFLGLQLQVSRTKIMFIGFKMAQEDGTNSRPT